MRALLLAALLLVPGVVLAAAPSATACSGDPSVCGTNRDVKCTLADPGSAPARCWRWLIP